MAIYNPQEPMPPHVLELRSRVLECSGLHMNFPYGIRLPNPPNTTFSTPLPHYFYTGFTLRGFFYAPKISNTETVFEMYCWYIFHRFASANIDKTAFKFGYSGERKGPDSKLTSANITVPGYYSVAVRVKDKTDLSVLLNDEELGVIDQETIWDKDWEWRMKGAGDYYLVSLHCSVDTDTTPTTFGQGYYLKYPWFGIGSYWLIVCVVEDINKLLLVTLTLEYGKDDNANVAFPLINVKNGEEVTVCIRSTRGGFVVTTTFDDKAKFIRGMDGWQNVILLSISNNCKIRRQYAEQGVHR